MNKSGHLYFLSTGWCVRPLNNKAISGATLELVQPSLGCDSFSFTKQGSLQHVLSRLCIQTLQKVRHKNTFLKKWKERKKFFWNKIYYKHHNNQKKRFIFIKQL